MKKSKVFVAITNEKHRAIIKTQYESQNIDDNYEWIDTESLRTIPFQMGDLILVDRQNIQSMTAQQINETVIVDEQFTKEEIRHFFQRGYLDVVEINQITEMFTTLKNQHLTRKRRIALNIDRTRQLKTSLAYDLLFGGIMSPRDIWMRSQACGLPAMPNLVFVVHIDHFHKYVRHKSKKGKWALRNDVMEQLGNCLEEMNSKAIIIPVAPEKIAILYAAEIQMNYKKYEQLAIEVATLCKNYIYEMTNYTVTIGIGRFYEDVRNIQISFEEAMKAQENRFFHGNNTVIHYNQLKSTEEDMLFTFNEAAFISKLRACNFQAIEVELKELEEQMFTNRNTQPQMLRIQMNDLLSTIARSAIQSGANEENVLRLYEDTQKHIRVFENVEEARAVFSTVSTQLMNEVAMNRSEQSIRSIQKAVQYIEDHYEHPITLEEIAEHVQLSSNYFSNLFKKATDTTFVDYLTNKRIERAKELLLDLNYTVYQIATKVGYGDARYFSRVFKATVGQTPTQYRNSKIRKSI